MVRPLLPIFTLLVYAIHHLGIILFTLCARHASDADEMKILFISELKGRPMLLSSQRNSIALKKYSPDQYDARQEQIFGGSGRLYLVRVNEQKKSLLYRQLSELSAYVKYVPYDTFQVLLTKSGVQSLLKIDGVMDIYDSPAELKTRAPVTSQRQGPESEHDKSKRKMDSGNQIQMVILAEDADFQTVNHFCHGYDETACKVRVLSDAKRLAIDTDVSSKESVMLRCVEHPLVTWVEEKKIMYAFNKYSSGTIQGFANSTQPHQPFWDAGLTGDNEIIGVANERSP